MVPEKKHLRNPMKSNIIRNITRSVVYPFRYEVYCNCRPSSSFRVAIAIDNSIQPRRIWQQMRTEKRIDKRLRIYARVSISMLWHRRILAVSSAMGIFMAVLTHTRWHLFLFFSFVVVVGRLHLSSLFLLIYPSASSYCCSLTVTRSVSCGFGSFSAKTIMLLGWETSCFHALFTPAVNQSHSRWNAWNFVYIINCRANENDTTADGKEQQQQLIIIIIISSSFCIRRTNAYVTMLAENGKKVTTG